MTDRLQKLISQAGLCSRREAEAWIVAGAVTVNGAVVTELGAKANPARDDIRVRGKPLALPHQTVLIAFHKPRGCLVTRTDPQGRPTVYDHLPPEMRQLKTIGRLDFNSEGLLLLTNDGELANRIAHPRHHLSKRYEVTTSSIPTASQLAFLRRGAGLFQPAAVNATASGSARRGRFEVEITEGKNRQIHRMCEAAGLTVDRLKRTAIGPIALGTLPKGKFRFLDSGMIRG